MPRRKGAANYKNDILINIVLEILPNGECSWQGISLAYQEQSRRESSKTLMT